MIMPQELQSEINSMSTMVELTGAFEGIASMRIAQIKNQVLASQKFFAKLWQIYTQIRVDQLFRFGRSESDQVNPKELFIAITAEGGFSGDIDHKLITWMLEEYDKDKHDIIVIGHHGAVQLMQNGVEIKKYYKLPERDKNINVLPIVKEVMGYANTTVYYPTYVSLAVLDVKKISLSRAVAEQGKKVDESDEIISEETYIFEPSTYEVIEYLEGSMMSIALSQVILDSKLAQYASRFRAMSSANQRAGDSLGDLTLQYNRARRALKDQRLKEIIVGMKKAGVNAL